MKSFLPVVVLLTLVIVDLSYGNVGDRPENVPGSNHCPKFCTREDNPVCGQMMVNGKLVFKMFPNWCLMMNANECEGGHYERCSVRCNMQCECQP